MKRVILILVWAALSACMASGGGGGGGGSARVPGATQSCACVGGATGVQTCNTLGTGYGACIGCPVSDGGTADACVATCGGRNCGDNGCGGSCGSCSAGQTCMNGTCTTPSMPCPHTANCSGRSCGPDGCGGTCGACPGNGTCNAMTGQCCTPNCGSELRTRRLRRNVWGLALAPRHATPRQGPARAPVCPPAWADHAETMDAAPGFAALAPQDRSRGPTGDCQAMALRLPRRGVCDRCRLLRQRQPAKPLRASYRSRDRLHRGMRHLDQSA